MTITPAQLAILKQRFPHIGESVLRINADALLSRPHLAVIPPPTAPPPAPKPTSRITPSPKPKRKSRVPLTRNAGTWSEAAYWQRLRSCLRRLSRWWQPARMALHAARVPCRGAHGQKWAYVCTDCGPTRLHPRKNVHVDHVVPAGTLTDYAHVADFIRRLLPEDPAAFAVRCIQHHQAKTNAERAARAKRSA